MARGTIALTVAAGLLLGLAATATGQMPDLQITVPPNASKVTNHSAAIDWGTNLPANATVRYGLAKNKLDRTAGGGWQGYSHEVVLRDLRPGVTYYYQVMSSSPDRKDERTVSYIEQFSTEGTFVPYYTESAPTASDY